MKRIIYGAGMYGKLLLEHFSCEGIAVDYFVQTNEPMDNKINGIEVISFARLIQIEEEIEVLLAIKNPKVLNEIKGMFLEGGRENIKIFNMVSFIDDNLMRRSSDISLNGNRYCIICKNKFFDFQPGGINEEIFSKYHIIGGGYRENFECPICKNIDRARWLYYVVEKKTDICNMKGRVLHFAPEASLSELIKENEKIDYYTGDIVAGKAMHVTDITDIQYKDNTFDYVISNHVMEHIPDEEQAVSEIKRVLKKDGKWIFSFPICTDIETYEDKTIVEPEERLKKYGQNLMEKSILICPSFLL